MTRRRFAFWLGFGLFTLADRLGLDRLDAFAAAAMGDDKSSAASKQPGVAVHWAATGDDTWRWFERENYIDGRWMTTGITTPIHKTTGERKTEKGGYLDDSLLPPEMLQSIQRETSKQAEGDVKAGAPDAAGDPPAKPHRQLPTVTRRSRHGRPPSKWLRSLHADELRIWLKSIEVPEAGVSGMTYWEHLTRDHSFDPVKIKGLVEAEQAKLHAAAHFGY
jgi:hypothetical protein